MLPEGPKGCPHHKISADEAKADLVDRQLGKRLSEALWALYLQAKDLVDDPDEWLALYEAARDLEERLVEQAVVLPDGCPLAEDIASLAELVDVAGEGADTVDAVVGTIAEVFSKAEEVEDKLRCIGEGDGKMSVLRVFKWAEDHVHLVSENRDLNERVATLEVFIDHAMSMLAVWRVGDEELGREWLRLRRETP